MQQIIKDFGIQPFLLAAQAVNFFILLFILNKLLYKPLLKVLDERKQRVAQSLKNAEEIEIKLQRAEEEREKKLAQAVKEASEIVDEAKKSAASLIQDAHAKASDDIKLMFEKGAEAIKQERLKIQSEIRADLAHLIEISLSKIIPKVLTDRDQKKIIDETIKNL